MLHQVNRRARTQLDRRGQISAACAVVRSEQPSSRHSPSADRRSAQRMQDAGQLFVAGSQVPILIQIADHKLRRVAQRGSTLKAPSCHAR